MPADRTHYSERRRVPWSWWVVTLLVAVPSIEVVAVFAPEGTSHRDWLIAIIVFAATVTVVGAVLLALSGSIVRVDSQGLWADGELLPAATIGRIRVLGRAQARLVLGRDADAAARLSIKPWLHRAIQVEVTDGSTPYWVVATRTPEALAAALREVRGTAPAGYRNGAPRLDPGASGDEGDHQSCSAGRAGAKYRAAVEKGPE